MSSHIEGNLVPNPIQRSSHNDHSASSDSNTSDPVEIEMEKTERDSRHLSIASKNTKGIQIQNQNISKSTTLSQAVAIKLSHHNVQSSVSAHTVSPHNCHHGNAGTPQTIPLCGYPVNAKWHPHITYWRTVSEALFLIFVFGYSFYIYSVQSTVTLVPSCNALCKPCNPQYVLQTQREKVTLPFRYYAVDESLGEIYSTQYMTFYSKFRSCGHTQSGKFSFNNQTIVHKSSSVEFPFQPGTNTSTTWPPYIEYIDDDLDPYNYYYEPVGGNTKHSIPQRNGLLISVAAGFNGGFFQNVSFNTSFGNSLDDVPTPFAGQCFALQCGVVDYFFNSAGRASSSPAEVSDKSAFPYVQIQATLTLTDDTVSAVCVGTVYGSTLPFFSTSNSIELSASSECTQFQPTSQVLSLSFANLVIAFGAANFLAKAATKISEIGLKKFISTFGGGVLDL